MLIIKEELLSILLEGYPDWSETPEKFLSFIMLVDQLSEVDAAVNGTAQSSRQEFAEQLAGLFIGILGVDISPYNDYRDLIENCPVEGDQMQLLECITDKMKEDDTVFDLTLETGIMPSKETMLTDMTKDILARFVIERLRPYVDFR